MPASQNGFTRLLSTLAGSSNARVQLATVALVALSGAGNWLATRDSAARSLAELEINRRVTSQSEERIKAELVRQVAEIHAWLSQAQNEFHQGNADSAANRATLFKLLETEQANISAFEARVTTLLTNQTKLLAGQTKLLEALHKEHAAQP